MAERKTPRVARAAAPRNQPVAHAVSVPQSVLSIVDQQQADNEAKGLKPLLPDSPPAANNGNGPNSESLAAIVQNAASNLRASRDITEMIDTGKLIGHDFTAAGPKTFTAINGVVLKIKVFPQETSLKIQQNMLPDRPMPERKFNEVNQKWVVDTDNPEYRKAEATWLQRAADVGFYVRAAFGTELLSVPEDVWGPDDDRWAELVGSPELFGERGIQITSAKGSIARYVQWLQYYALGEGDMRELYKMVEHASGMVTEKDVRDAERSFRDNN